MTRRLALLTVVAMLSIPAHGFEAKPFKPAPNCNAILGPDHIAGTKAKLFEMLRKANYFREDMSFKAADLTNMLLMLPLTRAEIGEVLGHAPAGDHRRMWQLKLAEASGDWSLAYDPAIMKGSADMIRIAAAREALTEARAGKPITVLNRFEDIRTAAIAASDDEVNQRILRDRNFEIFVAVGVLRILVLHGFETEAKATVAGAKPLLGLDVWLTAMSKGRAGDRDALTDFARTPWTGTLEPPTELYGSGISPLGEYLFQAIAAKRTELRDDLRIFFEAREMRQAADGYPLLYEKQDLDALAFALSITPVERYFPLNSIVEDLTARSDSGAIRSLIADRNASTVGFPKDADRNILRSSLAYALVRQGRLDEALREAGDLTLKELGADWTILGDQLVEQGTGPGEGILPMLVLTAPEGGIGGWANRLNQRQKLYFDFLSATQAGGSDEAERLLQEQADQRLFGDDPWRHIGYFQLTSAFLSPTPERFQRWYDYILEDPSQHAYFMSEWFLLVREQCLGWPYEYSGRTETGNADVWRRGSLFNGGVGGAILLDSE